MTMTKYHYIMDGLFVCVCLTSPLASSVLHGHGPQPRYLTQQALGTWSPHFPSAHGAACGGEHCNGAARGGALLVHTNLLTLMMICKMT